MLFTPDLYVAWLVFLCCVTNAMIMLVVLLKWLIFYHMLQCLKMVTLLLQFPLLFLYNVPLLFDDVVIGFRTICYLHLY
jgi:hypothetical protein